MKSDAEINEIMRVGEIEYFLFDLGGVFIDWDGIVPLINLTDGRLTPDQARRFWLESPWVRKFETGRCTTGDFGRGVVDELSLRIEPEAFLAAFYSWDKGPLPGAKELVLALKERYPLACLSNNNVLHWDNPALQAFVSPFDPCIVSHQVGLVKPDHAIYELAIRRIGKPARKIVYFDDNPECVDAARDAGLQAYQAKGVDAVRDRLAQLSIPLGP